MFKYLSNVFLEDKYFEFSDTSGSTGRGDFNNSSNVTHTQIQTDDDDVICINHVNTWRY